MQARVTFDGACLHVSDPRVFRRGNRRFVRTLARELAAVPGVAGARFDLDGGSCAVVWADGCRGVEQAARSFAAAVAAATAGPPAVARAHAGQPATIVRGPRRILYAAAGGGCLMMTVVGAIVPGIPTVPFLLGASYFLARSSRTLHAGLLATPLCGRIVREWDAHRGLSRESKALLAGCTVAVVAATVAISGAEPIVIGVVGGVVTLSLVGIARIPSIP
ncbi:MAG: DUF454 domain-containing protein [Planctomycetia bacterium]|nr:DUF454 domain-containing protein [Planctomycetia bacterium]